MGDNARKTWEWHNTVVGEGYQAKGVVRQRVSEPPAAIKIVDMRASSSVGPDKVTSEDADIKLKKSSSHETDKKSKKKKKDKDSKRKHSRRRSYSESSEDSGEPVRKKSRFNPLLQALSVRIRDNLHS